MRSLAGSGGIKHVVLVQFDDGRTEAVYLRRPHLAETTETTLQIAEQFTRALREHPEYSGAYDYDHYIRSLREQLRLEMDFGRELELSREMGRRYAARRPVEGWRFQAVEPSRISMQSDDVLHFAAIEGAVPFESLTEAQRRSVSRLIAETEFDFLLNDGVFDADRHLGNYLFDPVRRIVYPIDFSQVHRLERNQLLRPGDQNRLARILRALGEPSAGSARALAEAFVELAENRAELSPSHVDDLTQRFSRALAEVPPDQMNQRILRLLGELSQARVYLPDRFTLGVFKGLSIIANEGYAQHLPPGWVRERLRSFVTRETIRGVGYMPLSEAACSLRQALGRLIN